METSVIIGELLLRSNCVVIPNFGGFIATASSANFDLKSGLISPPKKSILFNKQLISNDGLLISFYAKRYNVTYEKAAEFIHSEVTSWINLLNNGERITIEKVGFLYLDNERNLCFEQDKFYNLLLNSYGLNNIEFVPIVQKEIKEHKPKINLTIEPPVERRKVSETSSSAKPENFDFVRKELRIKKTNNYLKYIAAACLLPIAFYSFWIPSNTDVLESGVLSFNDFNPFYKKKVEVYKSVHLKQQLELIPKYQSFEQLTQSLPNSIDVFPLEFDNVDLNEENDIFYVRLNNSEKKKPKKSIQKNVHEKEINEPKYLKYKVVVGSFSAAQNAIDLKDELVNKGYDAFVLHKERELIRVVAGDFATEQEAKEMIAKLATNQITGWIYK